MKTLALIVYLSVNLLGQTAVYPNGVVSDSKLKVLRDRAQTTLNAPLNASATSFTVVSGSKFATNVIVTIDSEQISICGVVGNTVTVGDSACPNIDGRGFGGTVAASHSSGAVVSANLVAWNVNAANAEIKALELYAAPLHQYISVPSFPTGGSTDADFFGGDLSNIKSTSFKILSGVQAGISVDSYYVNPPLIPDFTYMETYAGGSEGETVVNQANVAGQRVLFVKDTAPFSPGQRVIVNYRGPHEEKATIATLQPGVSLTMSDNLAYPHGAPEWVSKTARTLQTAHEVWLSAGGRGDNSAYFANVACQPAATAKHYAQNAACAWLIGSTSATTDGNYLQALEVDTYDNGHDVGEHTVLAHNRNSALRSHITKVSSDSAAGGYTLNVYVAGMAELTAGTRFRLGAKTTRDEILTVANNNGGAGPITTTTPLLYTHTGVQADWIDTSMYESSWNGLDIMSGGSGYMETGMALHGKMRAGFDTTLASLDTNMAAFTMTAGQRLYFNWLPGEADEAGYKLYSPFDPSSTYSYMGQDGAGFIQLVTFGLATAKFRNDLSEISGALQVDGTLKVGNACVVHTGSGNPNGAVVGSPCDIYLNTAGGAGATYYVKESGSATSAGWVGK